MVAVDYLSVWVGSAHTTTVGRRFVVDRSVKYLLGSGTLYGSSKVYNVSQCSIANKIFSYLEIS